MATLTELSLTELSQGLAAGDFSSEEVTGAYLSGCKQAEDLNSYIALTEDHALNAAKEADQRRKKGETGLLLGVPIAVKDLILTKGIASTAASHILDSFVPPYDATVVARFQEEGAFTLGKTNLDEFAMGSSNESSYFGAVKNPWDLTKVPGGSSGGSAVAVAARLAPAALGTDTGGSVRQPASFCGVVGVKPTYGRVSRYGVVAFASSLDQVGVFSRSVEDAALLLRVIAGKDPHDATSSAKPVADYSSKLSDGVNGLRIGIPKEYFVEGLDPEVEKAVRDSVQTLESLGATVTEISLPHTEAAVAVYYIIAPAEASSNLSRYDGIRYGFRAEGAESLQEVYTKSRSEGFGEEVKRRVMIGTYVLSSGYYDAYYKKAQQVRALIAQDFREAFDSSCDLIATPVSPTTAFGIGEKTDDPVAMYLNDIYTIPTSLAGLPAMSLPCGFSASGLPIGLQLIGNHFCEEQLFTAGAAFQRETSWHKSAPEKTWNSKQ